MAKRSIVPFGPQHPVLPEPIHLDLVLEDETVVGAVPSIGYVHRGLETLGYLPLDERHESRFGERTDLLVLSLLERYQQECTGKTPSDCHAWLRHTCRDMDTFLLHRGHPELRFLHFKTLDGEKKKARQ